jgi:hypothetical protein
MLQTLAISEKTTLKYLRDRLGLVRVEDPGFFPEWQIDLPDLTEGDRAFLIRIRSRFFYQLEEGTLLENGVKMMMVSPLLEVAGFYDPPFRTRFEPSVEVQIDDHDEVLQGRIDALVVQEQMWVWVLEGKRTTFSLSLGIPQAIAYLLANPMSGRSSYGLLCSGEDFLFIKFQMFNGVPTYGLSCKLSLLNPEDLPQVLQILRRLGTEAIG